MDTKQTILIVDDSELVRSYHSWILEQSGFAVISAVDGCDGLEKLFTNPCDLVITDINMGNMDGLEFIRRVRAEQSYHSLPIVIASTESDSQDKMRGFAAGATLYLAKPCPPDFLLESVRLLLTAA